MEFENKKLRSVAEAAARIMMGEKALHPNQQKLDVHEPEKDELTAQDFKKLRSMKKEETMHEESCDCGDCPSDKGMKKEEVDLDESKMAQLDSDLKDLSHDEFTKEYGKPKHHYDPSNFKKPVQKGQEMNRAKALAQRAMASMRKEEYELTLEDYSLEELEEFMMSEEFEQLDELNKDTLYSYVKKSERDQDIQFKKVDKGIRDNDPKSANKAGHKFSMRSIGQGRAENRLAKEEYEELEEMFPGTPEYEKKYGKAPQDMKKGEKKKTTQGEMEKTGKGVVHRRKFSEMVESYTEGGIKGLFRTLAEEPTSAEFDAQLNDAKKRAAGTKKQPEVSKPAVQAVQNEAHESKSWRVETPWRKSDSEDTRSGSERAKALSASAARKANSPIKDKDFKEEYDLEDFTQEELEEFMQTEEYEQLDELSKDTLKSYIPAAARDLSKKGIEAGINVKSGKRGVTKEYGDHFQKRYTGIIKATRKLAKESYEQQTHTTVEFIDYNDVNGVKYTEIDLRKKN